MQHFYCVRYLPIAANEPEVSPMVFRIEEKGGCVCIYMSVCVCVCACRHIHAIYMYVCVCIYKSAVYIGKWAVWWFGSSLWPFSISVRHRRLMETLSNEYAASWLLCVVVIPSSCVDDILCPLPSPFFLLFPPCADNLVPQRRVPPAERLHSALSRLSFSSHPSTLCFVIHLFLYRTFSSFGFM